MRQSSLEKVYLSTGCSDGTLGVWSLREMLRAGRGDILTPDESSLWIEQSQELPCMAMAWHPRQEGLLATGTIEPECFIRLYDLNQI